MQVDFYNNSSDNRQVVKKITAVKSITAECYEESSILNPMFICAYDVSLFKANYLYVAYYERYYYINDITIIDGHRMRISAHVDVLMTYSDQILDLKCIIDKQATDKNMYINDGSYIITDKTFNQIVKFPSGLLDSGEFILITAGG